VVHMTENGKLDSADDRAIRDQVLASPEEGWKTFWEIHGSFVLKIAGRFKLSAEDMEEVRQEICHALIKDDFKVLRTWNPERCSLRGFLSVVTAHIVLTFYRSSFHRFNLKKVALIEDQSNTGDQYPHLVDAAFTVTDRLYRNQVAGLLQKSLDEWVEEEKLSATDRSLVLLRLRGLTFKEISRMTGITTSHATVRFSRLKPLLRKKLEEAGIHPEI